MLITLVNEKASSKNVNNDEVMKWAISNEHLEIVKFLLTHGVDIYDTFRYARFNGSYNVVYFLIDLLAELGADIHACIDERHNDNKPNQV